MVVELSQLVEAATYLRDEAGFNFLSDITAVDYLGWGDEGVSGYIGTAGGRDMNTPMTQGYQVVPLAKPKRFAINYHLLALRERPERVRLQAWADEGEAVPSVIRVWPTADFHEREAYDLMGIADRRPPESEADPPRRRLGRPPAAQGLSARRRACAVLGGALMAATAAAHARTQADLRGHPDPDADPDRAPRRRSRCSRRATS